MEVGDGLLGIRRDDGDAVGGGHEEARAQNHVAIGVAVACGTKLGHLCGTPVNCQACAGLEKALQSCAPWLFSSCSGDAMAHMRRCVAFRSLQMQPQPYDPSATAPCPSAKGLLACRLLVAQAESSHELLGVGEVGVWVAAPEIFLGVAVQQRALRCSQLLQQRPA